MVKTNSHKIVNTVTKSIVTLSLLNIPPTTENKMMATASLIIPSPKTMENNFGYFVGLIIVSAATESDAQIVALYLMIRELERRMISFIFVHLLIHSIL